MLEWLGIDVKDAEVIGVAFGTLLISLITAIAGWRGGAGSKPQPLPIAALTPAELLKELEEIREALEIAREVHSKQDLILQMLHDLTMKIFTDTQVLRAKD